MLKASPVQARLLRSILCGALATSCNAGGGDEKKATGKGADPSGEGGAGGEVSTAADSGLVFGGRNPPPAPLLDGGCNRLAIGFEKIHPTVVLLIDRSSSMFDLPYGTSPDRWAPLKAALMDPSAGPVRALESDVRWGYTSYTGDGMRPAECPILRTVGVTFGNYQAILAAYDADSPPPAFKGETPTGVSLRAATAELGKVTEPGPKFILLATDGEPDTCKSPDPQCGQDESIRAVQDAFAAQIRTFVVGIGEVGEKHLRDLANAGVGQPVEAPTADFANNCINPGHATRSASYASGPAGTAAYYRPTDRAALEKDLRSIIGSVRTCTFALNATVDVAHASAGAVALDGANLGFEDPNGWRMIDETHLEITGTACQSIQGDGKVLTVGFPCNVATIIR